LKLDNRSKDEEKNWNYLAGLLIVWLNPRFLPFSKLQIFQRTIFIPHFSDYL